MCYVFVNFNKKLFTLIIFFPFGKLKKCSKSIISESSICIRNIPNSSKMKIHKKYIFKENSENRELMSICQVNFNNPKKGQLQGHGWQCSDIVKLNFKV